MMYLDGCARCLNEVLGDAQKDCQDIISRVFKKILQRTFGYFQEIKPE